MLKKVLFSVDFYYVTALVTMLVAAVIGVQMLMPFYVPVGCKEWWIIMGLVTASVFALYIWHDREVNQMIHRFVRWMKATTGNKHFGKRPQHTLAVVLAKK